MKIFQLLLPVVLIFIVACKPDAPTESMSTNGFKYKVFKTGNGVAIQDGEYAQFDFRLLGDGSELLQSSDANPSPPLFKVTHPVTSQKTVAPVQEVVSFMSPGDSAYIYYPIDSFKTAPPQVKDFKELVYWVHLRKIMNEDDYQSFRKEEEVKRKEIRDALNKNSVVDRERLPIIESQAKKLFEENKNNKVEWMEGPSGLKYVIHKKGKGPKPEKGEMVTAHYFGYFAESGDMFDTSFRQGSPYPFPLGAGAVIKGWDLGFAELTEGTTATLYVPYALAYGESGRPPQIPAKADLMFYVELVKVN